MKQYSIPDDFDDKCMALQEQENGAGPLWLQRGRLLHEYQLGAPKSGSMILYQRAADLWQVAISTVREDSRNAADFGDWLDEMPFQIGRAQIRCARQEARIRGIDALIVLQERADQTDKFGGMFCPPRVWSAQIKSLRDGKRDNGSDVTGRIQAASSAIATAMKRADGRKEYRRIMADLETVAAALEDLMDKTEKLQ